MPTIVFEAERLLFSPAFICFPKFALFARPTSATFNFRSLHFVPPRRTSAYQPARCEYVPFRSPAQSQAPRAHRLRT
jgi:hypothetical protein